MLRRLPVLKYPDSGFLFLMVLAMGIEGLGLGFILPTIFSGPHGRIFSAAVTLIFGIAFVTGAVYIAKGMAWVLFRLLPPRP